MKARMRNTLGPLASLTEPRSTATYNARRLKLPHSV